MGMHISRGMDTEVSEEGDVWPCTTASWGSAQGIGTSELLGIAGDRVYEGQKCNQYCEELYGAEEEFYWSAFLGQGIVCVDGRFG
jgi:hypothetical protein